MTDKQTYWVANLAGEKALLTGADERDRWSLHGWSETDEPDDNFRGFVWMTNSETGHAAPIPWSEESRDFWLSRGWAPSPPDEPVNPTKDPVLTDAPAAVEKPKGTATKSSAAPAAPSKES